MKFLQAIYLMLGIWRNWLAVRRERRQAEWERRNRRIPVKPQRKGFSVTPADSISTLRRIDHAPRR